MTDPRVQYPGRTRLPPLRSGAVIRMNSTCARCHRHGLTLSPSIARDGVCVPCLEDVLYALECEEERERAWQAVPLLPSKL